MLGSVFLFAWNKYYPCGGTNDFKGSFSTESDAIDYAITELSHYDIVEMVSAMDLKEIKVWQRKI